MRHKSGGYLSGVVIAVVLSAVAGSQEVVALAPATSGGDHAGSIQRAAIDLGGSPGTPAVNSSSGTLYVPIQCPAGYCATSSVSHVMDVINTATCNAAVTTGCRVVARARVGATPLVATVDERTNTVYVANATGTVTVVDGARCNATVTSGCGTPLATIYVGGFLVAAVFNPATRTLYVANPAGSVIVINGASCNAVTTAGCGQPARRVVDTQGPAAIDVDLATDTVYAVNTGTGNGNTVSVIDGSRCNGSTGTGCGVAPRAITVGNGAFWDAVDQASHTVYVANNNDGTVSVIDGAHCNAMVVSGCAATPPAVRSGAGTQWVGVDPQLHTAFALNQQDDTLAVINARTCNGTVTFGCRKSAPDAQAGSNRNPGYTGFPNIVTLLPHTDTAYIANVGGESRVSVITVNRCNAIDASGCRVPAPSVPGGAFEGAIDPATNTLYASNASLAEIDVLNGATCERSHRSGCAPLAKIPMPGPAAHVGAVDDTHHSLYASDSSGTVSVINTATCNAAHIAGCAAHAPTIAVGANPGSPVLNPATHTLYVPFGVPGSQIAVVDVATCNAMNVSGCAQIPAMIAVGVNTFVIAVSVKTDTIYAPNTGNPFASGDTMDVINGATCNRTDHSGCGHIAATVRVGLGPYGVAVNDATSTVYVANNANGDAPGTVSVINSASCNGIDTGGCAGRIPTVGVGRSPLLVAVNARTDVIYVTDFSSAGVSVLDGSTCNATVTAGCSTPAPERAVGSQPFGIAVNQYSNTIYAMTLFGAGPMSIFRGSG
jgi:DNA-binding beta-propeller fold protein YncE